MKLAVGCGRWVREGPPLFARVSREREWEAGDVWVRWSWDSTLSILLHCIWTSFWRLWIIKINLSGHKPPARVSLPFFIKSRCGGWEGVEKAILSRIHRFRHTSYADTEGMRENGYEGMPPVQEMITSLSLCGETSSLKASSWPSKPLNLA